MQQKVKLLDIAKLCGVSTATVSLALNDSPLVNAETKRRIREEADRLGYIPNEIARSLVKKRSGQIGVIVPDILNSFYATFVTELNRCVQEAGFSLTIQISDNSPEREERIVDEMIRSRTEGVIIVPMNLGGAAAEHCKRLKTFGIPFLFAVDRYSQIDAPCVMSDCQGGMAEIVKHLIGHGYTDIAYLNGDASVYSLKTRYDGYRSTMEAAGLTPHVIDVDAVDYDGACRAIEKCLQAGQLRRAFVCPNDMMALGVINTLHRKEIPVPERCAVTGFDHVIFSEIASVPITTVHQDIRKIAEESTRLLLRLIRGEEVEETELRIPTTLVSKKSI